MDSAQGRVHSADLSDEPGYHEVTPDEADAGSPWTAGEALAWLAEHRALVRVTRTESGERQVPVTVRPPSARRTFSRSGPTARRKTRWVPSLRSLRQAATALAAHEARSGFHVIGVEESD